MIDLNKCIIENCPSTAYYIPNFISEDEEQQLLKSIYDAPKPKWTQLKNRRLQNWGGQPQSSTSKGMIAEPMPNWLNEYCVRIGKLNLFEGNIPNHCLINEYEAGQGILPHEDGPLYFPTVCTISLGSHTMLDFYKPISSLNTNDESTLSLSDRYSFSLFLEPRSLVILKDEMYKSYLHGIKEVTEDIIDFKAMHQTNSIANFAKTSISQSNEETITLARATRVSITIRFVERVIKLKIESLLNKRK